MKDLIDLQAAHVTQTDGVMEGKSAWKIRRNITSEDLHELPGHLSETDVFTCLKFARKFELIAFTAGIDFQKKQVNFGQQKIIEQLNNNIKQAAVENVRLAAELKRHILKEL